MSTPDPREMAERARMVDLRLEQWYQARRLQLPLEVQAEFTAMAFEAIARDPASDPNAVLDTLIGELDERLGHIASTSGRRTRPSLMDRLRRPFRGADAPPPR